MVVHLHLHTEYSIGDAISRVEDWVKEAARLEMPAMAITDHGVLGGFPRFYLACRQFGVKPIFGCEVYFVDDRHVKAAGEHRKHLTLLATSLTGYHNLIKATNEGHISGFYSRPRIDWEVLRAHSEGIICLTGCVQGPIGESVIDHDDRNEAVRRFKQLKKIFGDRLYLEIQFNELPQQQVLNKFLLKLSETHGTPLVATSDCHYIREDHVKHRTTLMAIIRKSTVATERGEGWESTHGLFLKTEEQMMRWAKEYAGIPKAAYRRAILETNSIADRIEEFSPIENPKLPIPSFVKDRTPREWLRAYCERELERRSLHTESEYSERLERELGVIEARDFSNYFLVVADLINWAKRNDIFVGPGRGSAAGSIVSWLLNITTLDPIKNKLMFERFLTIDRVGFPDIDVDFPQDRRQEVMAWFRRRYGEKVFQIPAYGTFQNRNLLRDLVRVHEIDVRLPALPEWAETVEEIAGEVPEVQFLLREYPDVADSLDVMHGSIRQLGRHAAGFAIDENGTLPIIRYGGDLLSAWQEGESKELSEMGFIKFDLLGLTTLSILRECEKLTGTNCYEYPLDDARVYREFQRCNLIGVFQFDAWAAGDVIKAIKPTGFEDLIAAGALCRPGPRDVGMDKVYAARKLGKQKYSLPHPALKEVLGETYGVITYQEQMTELASKLANMSLVDAEKLRKDIVKKSEQVALHRDKDLEELKKKFIDGAVSNSMSAANANELWKQILSFARYGFNRSHSCSYAFISYWCMYQKVHHPAEFMASVLKFTTIEEKQWKILTEAKRLGIRIKRPDINKSDRDYALDNGAIRFGLSTVKYLGATGVDEILEKRPFTSIKDFQDRVIKRKVNSRAFTNLMEAGAFNALPEI